MKNVSVMKKVFHATSMDASVMNFLLESRQIS
jgi:hypothetical protein